MENKLRPAVKTPLFLLFPRKRADEDPPREMLSTETTWCCILRRSQQWVRPEMDLDNDRPVRRRLPGPLNDLLAGVEHQRAGRPDRAGVLYRRALRTSPTNPNA